MAGAGSFPAYNTAPVPDTLWYCTKGPSLSWDDGEAVCAVFEGRRSPNARAPTVKIEPEVLEEQADAKALLDDIGFRKARYVLNQKTTTVVNLSSSEDELLAGMKKSTRYGVRRSATAVFISTEPRPRSHSDRTIRRRPQA